MLFAKLPKGEIMEYEKPMFLIPPDKSEGVHRIRDDGGAKDVLFNMYARDIEKGKVIAGYWECFAGEILIPKFPVNEICFITEGSVRVMNKDNEEEKILVAGDSILLPKDHYFHWIIDERVKKIYMTVQEIQ